MTELEQILTNQNLILEVLKGIKVGLFVIIELLIYFYIIEKEGPLFSILNLLLLLAILSMLPIAKFLCSIF